MVLKLPLASKLESKMFRDVECASKTCFEEEVFQEECIVYVGDKPDCDPPCFVDGCSTEVEFNSLCEVWICEDKIKTTTVPTTTSTTSPSGTTTAPSSFPDPALTTSIVFNLIGLIVITSLTIALIVVVKKNRTPMPSPLPVPRQNLGSASEIQSLNPAIMSPSAPPAEDSDNGSVSVR